MHEESLNNVLHKTQEKINNNGLVTYNYESYLVNKINHTEYRDTNYIELEKLDENLHKLKFYISKPSYVNYFDGYVEKQILHEKSSIINHSPDEIAADSTYFKYRMNLMAQPGHFLDIDSSYTLNDSILDGRNVVLFSGVKEEIFDTFNIKSISTYVIDRTSYEPWIIKTTSIKNNDTTQILTHYFEDLEFSNRSIDFPKVRSSLLELGYAEISSNQLAIEKEENQLQIGSKLTSNKYTNMLGKETFIFGEQGKRTVLMLSFIGCGGCEYAMREMKKKNFEFKNDIDFFYSSPTDKSVVIKEYLGKKGFNGMGFGNDSKMNDHLNAYRFPTFFIINSSGTITNVFHGYRNGIEDEIF